MPGSIYQFVSAGARRNTPSAPWFAEAIEEYNGLNIRTCGDLVEHYAGLSVHARFVAVAIFLHFAFRQAKEVLLPDLNHDDPHLSIIVATAIGRFANRKDVGEYILVARDFALTGKAKVSSAAIFELLRECQANAATCDLVDSIIDILLQQGGRLSASDYSRGVEALAEVGRNLQGDDLNYRRFAEVLVGSLSHDDPEVRACAIHAVAYVCELKEAMPLLAEMAIHENASLSGVGTLSDLAKAGWAHLSKTAGSND